MLSASLNKSFPSFLQFLSYLFDIYAFLLLMVCINSMGFVLFSHRSHLSDSETQCEREREMFYLTMHSTHFIYGYMASDIWLRTILIVRKETHCRHIGYSYRLTARVLLYAPSHRQDNTYHGLCYTSRGALAGTRNSSKTQCITECHILLGISLTDSDSERKDLSNTYIQEWW